MNDVKLEKNLSLGRIAKRIPYYFVLAAFPISLVAAVQFMALEYMPVWNESELNMSKHRVVDFSIASNGQFAVVESLKILESNSKPFGISVTLTDLTDNSQTTLDCGPKVMIGAVSPCGGWLAVVGPTGEISISTTNDSKPISGKKIELDDFVQDLVWSNDSKTLIAKAEQSIRLIEARTGRIVARVAIDSTSRLVLPTEGNSCAVCSQGIYSLYDLDTGEQVREIPVDSTSRQVALSSDLRFAACLVENTLKMVDLVEGTELWGRQVEIPLSLKNAIAFTDEDRCVAIVTGENGSAGHAVNIYNVRDQRLVCHYKMQKGEVAGAHFASDDSIWLWNANGLLSRYDWQSQLGSGRQEVSLTQRQGLLPDFE